uniref:Uncharacterized protein n=1 Tax=Rhizophagus irregularis (strain DAOM 181602 / DAOM 197198 / MUCL 43194) TaxID=747089 RepID=U9TA20_RHIID
MLTKAIILGSRQKPRARLRSLVSTLGKGCDRNKSGKNRARISRWEKPIDKIRCLESHSTFRTELYDFVFYSNLVEKCTIVLSIVLVTKFYLEEDKINIKNFSILQKLTHPYYFICVANLLFHAYISQLFENGKNVHSRPFSVRQILVLTGLREIIFLSARAQWSVANNYRGSRNPHTKFMFLFISN